MSILSLKAASAKKTVIRTGDSEIRDELHRKSREQPDKEVTSAKNPASREPITFLADNNSLLSGDQPQRRSQRFNLLLHDDDNEFFDNDEVGCDDLDIGGPIQCNEDDDGPDFSRMVKKQATADQAMGSSANKKEQDIRKRF